jgi:hypothetical protein
MEDAISSTIRDSTWRWYMGSAFTRLMPAGAIVHIGTPFHDDGMHGRLLRAEEDGGDKWRRVHMPALSEGPGDPLGRTEGAALWPSHFPLDWLSKKRAAFAATGDIRDWHAQYLLRPLGGDGTSEWPSSYFPASMLCKELPQADIICKVVSCDPSKGRQLGDYSAIVTIYLDARGHLWVECDMARRPTNVLEDAFCTIYAIHKPNGGVIEVNGEQALIYVNVMVKLRKLGMVPNIKPEQAKDGGGNFKPRIRRHLDPLLKQGLIHIKDTPGGRLLLSQMKNYPYDKHDDGPDALAQGTVYMDELLRGARPGATKLVPVRAVG